MLSRTQPTFFQVFHVDHPFFAVGPCAAILLSQASISEIKEATDSEPLTILNSCPQAGQIAVKDGTSSPQAGHFLTLPTYSCCRLAEFCSVSSLGGVAGSWA